MAAVLLTCAVWQATGFAVDTVVVEAGVANEGDLVRAGAQWELLDRPSWTGGWGLGIVLEAVAGSWQPEVGDSGLFEVGVTPVFRFAPARLSSDRAALFLEAGVGVHFLSDVRFNDLNMSTSLQFGSHIGVGVHLGSGGRWTLVYRFQHLSNASIRQPNPGIEYQLLQIGVRLSRSR